MRQPPNELREDDTAVAAGAHQRAVCGCLRGVGEGAAVGLLRCVHDGLEGEQHVGAGVAVWHGEDVEGVDGFQVGLKRLYAARKQRKQAGCVQVYWGLSLHGAVPPALVAVILPPYGSYARLAEIVFTRPEAVKGRTMASCQICGKVGGSGHNVSHSKRRTNTRWLPNVHRATMVVNGLRVRVKACTRCIRSQYKPARQK